MKITDEAVQAALEYYSEGGCMGLDENERREVTESMLSAALPHLQPVDVAAVRKQAFEEAEKLCTEYARSFQKGLCHYGRSDKDSGRGRQEGHIDAGNELARAILALSAEPALKGQQHDK